MKFTIAIDSKQSLKKGLLLFFWGAIMNLV